MFNGMILVLLAIAATISGCGDMAQQPVGASAKDSPDSLSSKEVINFSGYLLSAFDITVDGTHYYDSEDFYTRKLDELEAMKVEAGYPNYKVTFDASIGLDDLKVGMSVYIIPDKKRGYAAEARIGSDGSFSVNFPAEAAGDNVRVRANKRVNVILNGPNKEVVNWCWNFSAMEKSVAVEHGGKPVILDTFETKVTKYKCIAPEQTGISIPKKADEIGAGVPVKIVKPEDLFTEEEISGSKTTTTTTK